MTKLWGGRFKKKTDPLVEEFTKSIHYDQKLAEYDCLGSLAHIDILKKAKLLNSQEHNKLKKGLEEILERIQSGQLKIDSSCEDIHTFIQEALEKKIGKLADKLQTCRSRNDQVVFDMKGYAFDHLADTLDLVSGVIKALKALAKKYATTYIPGYTHLQHAIPVRLADHLMAYAQMFQQDQRRLSAIIDHLNITMGSGALAGTFIDSHHYDGVTAFLPSHQKANVSAPYNALHTVSDRDFIIETLNALAVLGMHLSRLAEDFILWSTKEFDFIDIDEAFCTGSSLMPHKKNPDVLELIRGYSGRLYGNLVSVLVMMKGLPLSYNHDMQLDKEPLFDSFEIVQKELQILAKLLPSVKFKKENIERQLEDECLYATDIADYLVQKGVPFKEAHTIVGRLVRTKLETGKDIKDMSQEELKKFHEFFTPAMMKKIIDPRHSVESQKSVKRVSLRGVLFTTKQSF